MTKLSPQEIELFKKSYQRDRQTWRGLSNFDIGKLLSHIESQDKEIEKLKKALTKIYAETQSEIAWEVLNGR